MLMHAIAHGDCTDTVSGSALEADSGEKFLAAWEFEPALVLYCAWLFSRTLYQLSYRRPTNIFLLHRTRVTIISFLQVNMVLNVHRHRTAY